MTAAESAPQPQLRLAEQLEAIIMKKIANDQLVVPALPSIATRCLTLLKNPDFNTREVSEILESDPMIAARLLKLANSAAFGGRNSVTSIAQAVARVGSQHLKTLIIEASARKLFESVDRRIALANQALWTHSVAVALVARDLTAITGGGDPDVAYLSGLLHDIGKPVVAAMLLDAERAMQDARRKINWITGDEWIAVIQKTHRPVAVALAERWELPDVVQRTIRDCEEFDNADRLSAANIVRFANAVVKQEGIYVGTVDKDDNDALVMIGRSLLGLNEDAVKRGTAGLAAVRRQAP
jgi:putative nucleotidyltransferase with HDIG domain